MGEVVSRLPTVAPPTAYNSFTCETIDSRVGNEGARRAREDDDPQKAGRRRVNTSVGALIEAIHNMEDRHADIQNNSPTFFSGSFLFIYIVNG
jgi:hypothetical protein